MVRIQAGNGLEAGRIPNHNQRAMKDVSRHSFWFSYYFTRDGRGAGGGA
jgi:hypothetical protein